VTSFKSSKSTLQGVEDAERALVVELRKKCDWDIPEDRAFHMSESRRIERKERLFRLLGGHWICPYCRRSRWRQEEYVIITRETGDQFVSCRSCATTGATRARKEIAQDTLGSMEIFPKAEIRYTIDGWELSRARSIVGLTLRSFADLAGWSISYQRKLEGPARSVLADTAEAILRVFSEAGYETADNLSALIKEKK
jgi:hypothetical protein